MVWAKYWYQNIDVSIGFNPYKKTENGPTHQYDQILNECMDAYFFKKIFNQTLIG
jgi:hypothetical protein